MVCLSLPQLLLPLFTLCFLCSIPTGLFAVHQRAPYPPIFGAYCLFFLLESFSPRYKTSARPSPSPPSFWWNNTFSLRCALCNIANCLPSSVLLHMVSLVYPVPLYNIQVCLSFIICHCTPIYTAYRQESSSVLLTVVSGMPRILPGTQVFHKYLMNKWMNDSRWGHPVLPSL